LHSHYGLAGTYRLKGIHGKLPLDAPAGISISSSFHSLRECIQTGHRCDYAFLSPVFDSISKRDYKSGLDKNELTALLKNRPGGNKLIALGGIDEQTIPVALGYGFDGVAVLGALWTSPNPLEKYKRLRDVTASFHLSITHHHA
jgi:thiamine-phosphate pyrophosphorylase